MICLLSDYEKDQLVELANLRERILEKYEFTEVPIWRFLVADSHLGPILPRQIAHDKSHAVTLGHLEYSKKSVTISLMLQFWCHFYFWGVYHVICVCVCVCVYTHTNVVLCCVYIYIYIYNWGPEFFKIKMVTFIFLLKYSWNIVDLQCCVIFCSIYSKVIQLYI